VNLPANSSWKGEERLSSGLLKATMAEAIADRCFTLEVSWLDAELSG